MFYRSPSKSNLQRSVTYTNPPPRISLKSNVTWTNPSSSSTWPSSLKLSSYRNIIINLLCTTYLVTPASTRLEATMTREVPKRNRDVCMSPWCLVTSHQSPVFGGIYIYTHRQRHRPYHHFINLQSVTASAFSYPLLAIIMNVDIYE